MTKEDIFAIKQLLSSPKKIVIIPHKNPDGDAMGSTLGLYHFLLQGGHQATVIAPNDYPQFLKWLPGDEKVLNYELQNEQALRFIADADILFALDFTSF